jgi:hypothetical protein
VVDESWKSLEIAILLYGRRSIFSTIGSSVEHRIGSAYINTAYVRRQWV